MQEVTGVLSTSRAETRTDQDGATLEVMMIVLATDRGDLRVENVRRVQRMTCEAETVEAPLMTEAELNTIDARARELGEKPNLDDVKRLIALARTAFSLQRRHAGRTRQLQQLLKA